MANASRPVSLPSATKDFIETQLRGGTFSAPSEYIRSLIRMDQECISRLALEAFVRKGFRGKALPKLDEVDWSAIQALVLHRQAAGRADVHVSGKNRLY